MSQTDPVFEHLEDQIEWYDRRSLSNKRIYKRLKTASLVIAILIPLSAGFGPPLATGILGALVAIIEAIQQVNQYHHNWTTYRSTCELLRHEKYLYLGESGPYASAANPRALLAERVESLVSQEHAKWASAQQQAAKASATKAAT